MRSPLQAFRRILANPRSFVRTIAIYGLGQAGMKGLDLVAFALLVRALTPAEFGFVGGAALMAWVVGDLASAGVFRIGVPRFAADGGETRAAAIRSGNALFILYAALLAGAALLLPAAWLERAGGGSATPARLYACAFVVKIYVCMHLEILRMDHRPVAQSALEAVPSAVNVLLLLALLPHAGNKLEASGLCLLAAWLVPFVPLLACSLGTHPPRLGRPGPLLRYAATMTVNRGISEFNAAGSRWIVLLWLGLPATGAFTFLMRLGELFKVAQQPLVKAWTPAIIASARERDGRRAARGAIVFLLVATGLYLLALPFATALAEFIDKERKFQATYAAIPVVVFGTWLLLFAHVFGVGFTTERKPAGMVPVTALAALVNLGATCLILRFGELLQVPYALALGNAAFAALTIHFGRRMYAYADPWVARTGLGCLLAGCAAIVLVLAQAGVPR